VRLENIACTLPQRQADVSLQKYKDPQQRVRDVPATDPPDMHPSTLGRTSAVDGDRLFALLGDFILEVRPLQQFSDADLLRS